MFSKIFDYSYARTMNQIPVVTTLSYQQDKIAEEASYLQWKLSYLYERFLYPVYQ